MKDIPAATSATAGASPVVLLHGVGLDRTMWQPLQSLIGRDTIALDLPGHGTRPPLLAPQTLATLADDVLARLPDGAVHLVGFSLGALIAQHIARFHPERVVTLSCVSTVCRRTPDEAAAVASRLATAGSEFSRSVTASIQRWFPEGTRVSPETIAEITRVLRANDVQSYLHSYAVFASGDQEISSELGLITVPTLAITGELDPGSTPEMSRRLVEAVPNARLVIVPGIRHMLPVEDAPALGKAITTFIDESEGEQHD